MELIMYSDYLLFPSGRSVKRCKQDAKKLVKESKSSDSPASLNQALDALAIENGIKKPWHKALEYLAKRNRKSPKKAQIHLLGHALNKLINMKLVDMDSTEKGEDGHLECELLGKPTIITWQFIGHGEFHISTWWNFDETRHPQHLKGGYSNRILMDNMSTEEIIAIKNRKKYIYSKDSRVETYSLAEPLAKSSKYKDFMGVLSGSWVERKDGKYLQTWNGTRVSSSYVRNSDKEALCNIPDCKPIDFSLKGKFIP